MPARYTVTALHFAHMGMTRMLHVPKSHWSDEVGLRQGSFSCEGPALRSGHKVRVLPVLVLDASLCNWALQMEPN